MIHLSYLSRRVEPRASHTAGEVARILRYTLLLATCWFLLSAGIVYVVVDIFAYVNGSANFSLPSMAISLGALVMTIAVGMSLYVLRPRA